MSKFIKGDAIILSIHDGSAYLPVACLTSNSLSQTRSIIESQTKCDPGVVIKDAGTLSYDISAEGRYIDTTSVGAEVSLASHDKLKQLMEVGEDVTWRMDTGLTDTPYYYGVAIIQDLSFDAAAGDELVNFSTTLAGSGAIVEVDPIV